MAEIYGSEGDGSDIVYGTTDSYGYAILSTIVYYEGYEEGHHMSAAVISGNYTVVSSSNTYSNVSYDIDPDFDVILDTDQNGIQDNYELPLAEKFCPMLVLHHPTEWIAPEPVEYIGVDKSDLWFLLYNSQGQQVDDYPITDESLFSPPVSNMHPWISNPACQNYSDLSADAYDYVGAPPGKAYGVYDMRFHYNYAGNARSPNQWISHYETERNQNNFPHTIYAHLFLHNNKPVIQYWMFYPYNDGYNNHEGDWEHINVRISSAEPSSATIEAIDYYFHHKVKTLTSGYSVHDTFHPYVFVGGSCAGMSTGFSCQPGNTTGGSYPWTGTWYDVGPEWPVYDEYVDGMGPEISHNDINIIIIPNRDKIDYDANPEMSWLNVPIRWGELEVDTPWGGIEDLKFWDRDFDIGNNAPLGPAFNSGWPGVGAVGDYENY